MELGEYYSDLCALIVYSVQVLNPTMTKCVCVCVCVGGGGGGVRVEGGWKSLTGIVVGENQLSGVWWVIKGIYRCMKSSTMGIGWK